MQISIVFVAVAICLKPPYRQRPSPSSRARLPPQRNSNPSSHPATPYPAPAQAQSVFSSVYLLTQSPSRLMSSLATRAVLSTAGFRQIVPKSACFVTHLMPSSFVLSDSISLQHIFSGIVGQRAITSGAASSHRFPRQPRPMHRLRYRHRCHSPVHCHCQRQRCLVVAAQNNRVERSFCCLKPYLSAYLANYN